jgi:hypothetical protein
MIRRNQMKATEISKVLASKICKAGFRVEGDKVILKNNMWIRIRRDK